jgi:MFS family permease
MITLVGYGCIFAIPLMAFAHTWIAASALIIVERIGKAIRTPSRDAMLSYATQKMGRGVGFGLHQLLDQLGGVLGPFLMTIILLLHRPYTDGFLILFIPAFLTMTMLGVGMNYYPTPQNLEVEPVEFASDKIPTKFWIFLIAAGLMAMGYADFPLIAFHFGKARMMAPVWIPVFYMIAMGMSALSALTFGLLYDKKGAGSLMIAVALSAFFSLFIFSDGFKTAIIGCVLWGIGIGAQRSLLKAIVGDMIPKKLRGSAFGIFNTGYGVAWFLGSWLMGVLYDTSIHGLIGFSIVTELLAIPVVYFVGLRKIN